MSVICLALDCVFLIVAYFPLKAILFYTVYITRLSVLAGNEEREAHVNINKFCLGHCTTVTYHLSSASYWLLSSTLDMIRDKGQRGVTVALVTHESPQGCASQGWELATAEHVMVSPEVTELPVATVHRMPVCQSNTIWEDTKTAQPKLQSAPPPPPCPPVAASTPTGLCCCDKRLLLSFHIQRPDLGYVYQHIGCFELQNSEVK